MRYLLPLLAAAAVVGAAPANAQTNEASTLAVIGDVPYGAAQIAGFPTDISEINADPSVGRVLHLGDIKDGSSRCDDAYFAARVADFQTFADSFIYTPGDNEWTDCHRANNGGYLPTERLDAIRRVFFPVHGRTLGAGAETVAYQSDAFPENIRWTQSGVTFADVHVVGSDDNQATWYGDRTENGVRKPETAEERELRVHEYTTRGAATLAWIDATFDAAERDGSAAVAIGLQANMGNQSAFAPIQAKIAERATRFGKPVLLMQGDSHLFFVDRPAGMPANVTRFVVQGSTNNPRLWLRLHVDGSASQPFSCENVEYRTGAVTACPAPLAPIATAKGTVGGTVGATLALTLGAPATFGAFVPGVAADYTASTPATVTSTAGDATLSVADPGATHTGHLVNGAFFLPQTLRAAAGGASADVGGVTSPTTLRTYGGPVSGDVTTLSFIQAIGASDALRTGTYAKTLTFTVSTAAP
jgi:hypothetical protein